MSGRSQGGTIVVLASNGFVVRNYLLGRCAHDLRAHARVLALSPLHDQDEFVAAMTQRGVEVGPLYTTERGRAWRRVRRWRDALHVARLDTATWRMKQSSLHHDTTRWQEIYLWTTSRVAGFASNDWTLRRFDLLEERHALRSPAARQYRELFARAGARVVFSAAPLNPDEWLPIQVARSMGIPTVLSILSWDNLSSKSRIPLPTTSVLVWGEAMREEMRAFYPWYEQDRVHVTGAPQFEFYHEPHRRRSREEFCRSLRLDAARKLVVYAGVTASLMPDEPRVVAGLAEALRAQRLPGNPQLLLRLHPKDDGARYHDFAERYPEVRIVSPGARHLGDLRTWRPTDADVDELVNTMWHGDVHLNVASTMTIDAAVVDRPVVNIAYDLRPFGARPSWGICGYDFTHYAPIVRTGGVRIARSEDELLDAIASYLANPSLDRAGRRRIVQLQCGPVDGMSGQRVAMHLLAAAGNANTHHSFTTGEAAYA